MDAINSDNNKRDCKGKAESEQTKSTVTCTESIGLGQVSLPPATAVVAKRTKNLQTSRKSYPSIHTRSSTSSSSTSTVKRPYQPSNPDESKSKEVPVKITRTTKARNEQECSSIAMAGPQPPVDPIQDIAFLGDRDHDTNVSLPRPYCTESDPNAPRDLAVAGPSRNSKNGEGSKGQGQGQQGDANEDKNTIRVQKNGSNSVIRLFPKESSGCWFPITFESTKDSAKTYKINKEDGIRVLCEEGNEELSSPFITQENIKQVISGLVDFRIQIEKIGNTRTSTDRTATDTETDTRGIIKLVRERPLEKNELEDWNVFESVVKPEERTNKELKFVLVEYFEYNFSEIRIPPELFAEGKSKLQSIFKLDFVSFHADYNVFTFNVNLSSQAILGDENYDKGIWEELEAKDTIPILNYFLKPNNKLITELSNSGGAALSRSDSGIFYSLIRDFRSHDDDVPDHDIPNLIARLKDYQANTVRWMLKREGAIDKHNSQTSFTKLQDFIKRQMYIQTKLWIGNERVYYCPSSGEVTLEKYKQRIQNFPTGGILADEIGLGKTFTVLAGILMNKRPGFEDVAQDMDNVEDELEVEEGHGPRNASAMDKPEVKAKRTPKVYAPPSKQTRKKGTQIQCRCERETAGPNDKEIKILTCTGTVTSIDSTTQCNTKHHATCFGYDPKYLTEEVERNYLCQMCVSMNEPVPSKSTLIVVPDSILHQWEDELYHNVADLHYLVYWGMSDKNSKYQPPAVLSKNDIVLTTYEVLTAEIPFTGLTLLPSPLTSVGWWRVCLDEAQLVANVKSNLSKLACRLPAVHRWCITGTPIVHSIQDLFGLVKFLGVEPICKEIPWDTMIMEPFRRDDTENIKKIFGRFFWRTGKEEVAHELELPMQTEVFHRLEFSPVEKLFHAARYRFWSDKLEQELKNFCDRDPSSEYEIRCPLNNATKTIVEKMRQICIHPELEDANNGENGQSMAKLNFKGLLSKLKKECEDVCSDRKQISEELPRSSTKQSEFDKSTSHLAYLQTLEALDKNGHGKYGSVNPENCSCAEKRPLGQKWGFLPCGHCICTKCCVGFKDIEASSVCPQSNCNQSFQYSDIVFVDTESTRQTSTSLNAKTMVRMSDSELPEWPLSTEVIKGESFTKVEAIVRSLKSIAINHPNEKVLVVTAWKPMLEVLGVAFKENSIPFTNYAGDVSSRSALKSFRRNIDKDAAGPSPLKEDCDWWKQVLLMQLSAASTGLHLAEASHILLVEPILNILSELQAIGRIHRLGQTRKTYIHRFYVAGTVEERFHERRLKKTKDPENETDFEEENMSIADLKELLMPLEN